MVHTHMCVCMPVGVVRTVATVLSRHQVRQAAARPYGCAAANTAGAANTASNDEVVRLLRSIDQKLDSRLVETPATVGQAVHRVGFIAENLGKDMRALLADTRRLVGGVDTIKSRTRHWGP